jgi:hypothetical protein
MKLTFPSTVVFQATLLFLAPDLVVAEFDRRQLLQVFNDFGKPDLSVLKIDLDQRSIIARTALSTEEGLKETEKAYESGNVNPITLKSLSTGDDVYRNFDLYNSFVKFYGGDKFYADTWIQAAFDNTNPSLGERNVNFPKLNAEGRSSSVRWGTLTLNVFMGVVSCMHQAIDQCATSPDDARKHWDNAFAYFAGSLAEAESPLGGYLLYNFVQMESEEFGTCKKGEESPINKQILSSFVSGKEHLSGGHCTRIKDDVKRITAQLTVPLVQASLRAMYAMDNQDDSRQETQGEAAAFSAALAPIISTCNSGYADIIYNDMSPGKGTQGSYEVVKDSLEKSYECLKITCADVGGLISLTGEYLRGTEACNNVQPVSGAGDAGYSSTSGGDSSSPSVSNTSINDLKDSKTFALGITLGILFSFLVGTAVGFFFYRKRKKESDTATEEPHAKPEITGVSEDVDEAFDVERKTENIEIV